MDAPILFLTATSTEQTHIRSMMTQRREAWVAGKPWLYGRLATHDVLLVQTGVGAVNTAHALTCAFERHAPALVMQFGVGGAYQASGLDVGDLAVATEEIYGELGVLTPAGWRSAEFIGIPLLEKPNRKSHGGSAEGEEVTSYFNRYGCDAGLSKSAYDIIAGMTWPDGVPNIKTGPFITVQQCSGVTDVGNEIAARFNGICENMEGAAAAHLCTLYDTPFIEIRSISNRVEDRDPSRWNLPMSIRRAQLVAAKVIESLEIEN